MRIVHRIGKALARLMPTKQQRQDIELFSFILFNICVFLYAVVLMVTAVYPVHAQNREEVSDLQRRVSSIEALNLDHRLTVIETMLTDLHSDWTRTGSLVGVALLIAERAAQAVKQKIREADE